MRARLAPGSIRGRGAATQALSRAEGAPVWHPGSTQKPTAPEPARYKGGSRSHEASTEPPSACGISPRRAGGRGEMGLRAGIPGGAAEGGGGGRAAGQVGGVGSLPLSRCATAPPRGGDWSGMFGGDRGCVWRWLGVADRGERGSGRHLHPQSGGRGERGGRSPDSVGRSWDSVGRTPDSVGHSLWPTGAA